MFKYFRVLILSISGMFGSIFLSLRNKKKMHLLRAAADRLTRFDYIETIKIMKAMRQYRVKSYKRGKTEINMMEGEENE